MLYRLKSGVRVKILRNPTHGSGWMLQARPTKEAWTILSIPPTAVGGSFRASLRCGIEWRCLGRRAGYRLYLKHPPTAVGGSFKHGLQRTSPNCSVNSTHGSGWIVLASPTEMQGAVWINRTRARLDVNYPPTSVGGIPGGISLTRFVGGA